MAEREKKTMTQIKITFKGAKIEARHLLKALSTARKVSDAPTCKGIIFGDNLDGAARIVEIKRI